MDSFEEQLAAMLDYQHFEENPKIADLISDFDKSYQNNNSRERISFGELVGGEKTAVTKRPEKADTEKSKDISKE